MKNPLRILSSLLIVNICVVAHVNGHYNAWKSAANTEQHFSDLYRDNLQKLVAILDEESDPCDDFFQHACGNYENYIGGSEESADGTSPIDDDRIPPFLYNKEDRMHFFEEHKDDFETRAGKVLRQVYDECKGRYNLNYRPVHKANTQSHRLMQWMQMMGEIDFLKQNAAIYKNWPYLRYQWEHLNRYYSSNWVALAALMAAHGVPSLWHIFFAKQTIYIASADNVLHCRSLAEIRESLLPLLQRRKPQVADIVSRELWTFCGQLTNRITVSEETETSDPFIDDSLAEYLQSFFALLNFTETEISQARKVPIDVNRLAEVLQVLRSTEPRIIYNFLLWHAYETLRYDDCYLLTDEFEDLLLAEYWHWSVFESFFSRDVAMAKYIFHTIRFHKQRKQTLISDTWDKFLLAKLERKDFNIERLIKQYANTHLNFYNLSDLNALETGKFYSNLLELRRYQLRASFHRPLVEMDDENHASHFLRQFLDFTILSLKQPLYYYFASQGFSMWHESNLLYSSDSVYTALDCLEVQAQQERENPLISPLSLDQVEQLFRFFAAFAESMKDYKFWLDAESFAFTEEFVLEYFDLNSHRILFYAVSQMFCGRNDDLYRPIINRSFMNMPEFSPAFNCSAEAPMNPGMKCMLRNCD